MRWRETLTGPSSRKSLALTVQDETIYGLFLASGAARWLAFVRMCSCIGGIK
jgi:hypothetical protein